MPYADPENKREHDAKRHVSEKGRASTRASTQKWRNAHPAEAYLTDLRAHRRCAGLPFPEKKERT